MTRAAIRAVLGSAILCLTATLSMAQTTTATSETKKFTIVAVEGNELVVKLPEGTRQLSVPSDFRFNVDGKSLSVQELKPGMTGSATITTTTTVVPVTVTEVKNGTVMQALGTSIIVRTGDQMKVFSQGDVDKRGVKIFRDGKPAQISDFRVNDQLSATIVTTKPPRVLTSKEVQATLAKADPTAPAPATAPTRSEPAASAATTGTAPRQLPKTGSPLPLLGFTGLASLAAGLALTVRRRRATS